MPDEITIALAGNPNAGKTTIFNAITGARQHVGNWPGVTVEKKEGGLSFEGREIRVVDLPGTYSLTAYSTEEIIARQFIVDCAPDVVVNVVDASNLERNLYLCVQLLEMGAKVIIALNMIDVAQGRKIHIDHKRLSELLGVPVVPTNGKKGIGIEDLLREAVREADGKNPSPMSRRPMLYGTEIDEELDKIEARLQLSKFPCGALSRRWLSVKLLEEDAEILDKIGGNQDLEPVFSQVQASRKHLEEIFADPPEILLTDARYGFISGAVRDAVKVEVADRIHLSETIDRVLTNRFFGPLILFVVLYFVYLFTFQGSEPLVKLCEAGFKWIGVKVGNILPDGLLRSLVVSGVIDGVGGVLGFAPLIAFMFMAIAVLEDTGYMARIAFMLDRVLRGFGLHGASMLALMVSGGLAGGCAVPGIMATRTLREPKERLVTILVAPLMNCGAKLPVYALLIGAFFPNWKVPMMFLLTLISWSMALLAGKLIRSTVLAGPSAPFVLELPPYRVPTLRGVLIHTWERTWMYVKKAGTVILAVSVLLWALMTFPALSPEKSEPFDERRDRLCSGLLANPSVAGFLKSKEQVEQLQELISGQADPAKVSVDPKLALLVAAIKQDNDGSAGARAKQPGAEIQAAAASFREYVDADQAIELEKRREQLRHTIGGRIGVALETVFKPIGFDWRTNVALLGGFAAKEVVVATLGTAYSLGDLDTAQPESLSERLKKEPGWNPLMAFTLIMFVMLYNPCLTTLVVIAKESGSLRWTLFAMIYTTTLAYATAWVVHTVGSMLGLGLS